MKKNLQRSGILAAGTWTVDYTKEVAGFPSEGACTQITRERVHNGGAPYNLLVDLRRLGASYPLRALGCLGKDVDGANILKDCRSHDIDATNLRVIPQVQTSFSDVMVSAASGMRTSFNYEGANALLGLEAFDFAKNHARIFFLGTILFLSKLDEPDKRHGTKAAAALAAARKAGIITCTDIERAGHVPVDLFLNGCRAALRQTDLIVLNVEVAGMLAGRKLHGPDGVDLLEATEAAKSLLDENESKLVVIRFPSGAVAAEEGGNVFCEGSVLLPRGRKLSTNGAGHAFTAGLLHGHHEGWSVTESLKLAHAAAASCLLEGTASGGVRKIPACQAVLKKYGQRHLVAQ